MAITKIRGTQVLDQTLALTHLQTAEEAKLLRTDVARTLKATMSIDTAQNGKIQYSAAYVPTGDTELVPKSYVDSVAQGLTFKQSVAAATTATLVATYSSATKRLTAVANGALSIDNVSPSVDARILVKNQGAQPQVTTVNFGTLTGAAVAGKYFLVSSTAVDYYVWFNTGADTDPAPVGKTEIEVAVNSGDDAAAIALAAATALDAFSSGAVFDGSNNTNILSILNVVAGAPLSASAAGDSGATVNTVVTGYAANILNGIYKVINAGGAGAQWILERTSDFDGTPAGEVAGGAFAYVDAGTTNGDSGWVVTSNGVLTIDTNAIVWAKFSEAGFVEAGNGITKTGNVIAVRTANGLFIDGSGNVAINMQTGANSGGVEVDGSGYLKAKVDGSTISFDETTGALKALTGAASIGDHTVAYNKLTSLGDLKIIIGDGATDNVGAGLTGDVTVTDVVAGNAVTAIGANKVTLGMLARQTDATLLVGKGVDTDMAAVAMSGDVTMASTGITAIGANKVTLGMLARTTSGNLLIGQGIGTDVASVAMSGDVTIDNTGATVIGNYKIDAQNLVKLTDGQIFVGKTDNDVQVVTMSGDITMTNAGVTAIGANKVTLGQMARATSGYLLIGQGVGSDLSAVAMSGDATIDNTGAVLIGANKITSSKIDINSVVQAYFIRMQEKGMDTAGNWSTWDDAGTTRVQVTTTVAVANFVIGSETLFLNGSALTPTDDYTLDTAGANVIIKFKRPTGDPNRAYDKLRISYFAK